MTRVRVESFTISLDGYGAGPSQDVDDPLGIGGTELHQWAFPTRTFQRASFGSDGGTTGIDDDVAARGFTNIDAWILGRNMFGAVRGVGQRHPCRTPAPRGVTSAFRLQRMALRAAAERTR